VSIFSRGERVAAGDVGCKVTYGDKVALGNWTEERDGQTVGALGAGDVFGETALLAMSTRNATVRATTATDVISVSRDAFEAILRHVPGVAPAMERIVAARVRPCRVANS
jgi:CRP-like cAMP-binding protein